jgi:hypothetical protein
MRYLTVDGMLSGTGVRDSVSGGYLNLRQLGLSDQLIKRIDTWLTHCEKAHYVQYRYAKQNEELDNEGIAIREALQEEMPNAKVEYFSNAKMQKILQ